MPKIVLKHELDSNVCEHPLIFQVKANINKNGLQICRYTIDPRLAYD